MTVRTVTARLELAYAVAGAPVAWLTQINVTYPLIAEPCFPGSERNLSFPPHAHWAFILAVVADLALLGLAIGSAAIAHRIYRRFATSESTTDHFEGAGTGRIRFLAFCGMLLGAGFSAVILLNALPLLMVPPCAI